MLIEHVDPRNLDFCRLSRTELEGRHVEQYSVFVSLACGYGLRCVCTPVLEWVQVSALEVLGLRNLQF